MATPGKTPKHPTITLLKKATRGLVYMSEKDAPFKTVILGKEPVDPKNIAVLLQQPADAAVEELNFDKVFGELTKPEKWHGEDELAYLKKYKHLAEMLREHLSDLKVFKVGERILKVAIVGKATDGQWLALTTEALET
ncbi:MAG: nuclease A inhibitor family protein [Gemmataceae bacterium]|nr:nuclease A inhibitor family protein [Gemmataceae bacterium]